MSAELEAQQQPSEQELQAQQRAENAIKNREKQAKRKELQEKERREGIKKLTDVVTEGGLKEAPNSLFAETKKIEKNSTAVRIALGQVQRFSDVCGKVDTDENAMMAATLGYMLAYENLNKMSPEDVKEACRGIVKIIASNDNGAFDLGAAHRFTVRMAKGDETRTEHHVALHNMFYVFAKLPPQQKQDIVNYVDIEHSVRMMSNEAARGAVIGYFKR